MTVTKITYPRAELHQLIGGEAWPSGIFPDDIVDVVASLGHVGDTLLIEGHLGAAKIRVNVTEKVFARQKSPWTDPHDIPFSEFYSRPVASGEYEVERTTITIESGSDFALEDARITDFKVVELASGVRITFF